MNPLADIIRAAKAANDLEGLVAGIPYLQFLGVSMGFESGELVGKMKYSDPLIGNTMLPAIHGGTIGALLESTAAFQTMWEVETLSLPKIVTITVDFLRPGRPVDTFAKATITKHGRRVVNVGIAAWQDDRARPIARGHAAFLVEPTEP